MSQMDDAIAKLRNAVEAIDQAVEANAAKALAAPVPRPEPDIRVLHLAATLRLVAATLSSHALDPAPAPGQCVELPYAVCRYIIEEVEKVADALNPRW
jgi:hypothetical protein